MKIARGAWAVIVAASVVASVSGAVAATAASQERAKPAPLTVDGPDTGPLSVVPAAQPKLPPSSTVTLVTGHKVRLDVDASGAQSASVLSPSGDARPLGATFTEFAWHGDQYVIPNLAAPYLSTLDPRLFDVSYLVRAHLDDAHASTLPVKVSYSGASTVDLPGVRVSHRSGASATATVTKAKAGQFGQRLAEQWRASRSGKSSQPVGRLSGVDRIELAPAVDAPALPAAPADSSVKPQAASGSGQPFRTVTINGIDLDGGPGALVGYLQNVDHPEVGPWFVLGADGPVTFSVPEGTYSVELAVMTGPYYDWTVKSALVVKPEITIDSDETITLDARTAVPYQVNLDPAVTGGQQREESLSFSRTGVTGGGVKVQPAGISALPTVAMHMVSFASAGNPTLYATPTSAVTKGTFDFAASAGFFGSSLSPSPLPGYFMIFPHAGGIPSSLNHTVRQADFTAVHQKIYNNPGDEAQVSSALQYKVYLPWGEVRMVLDGGQEYVVPGGHIDYLYSGVPDQTIWVPRLISNTGRQIAGARRTISNGQQLYEEWNKGPFVPSVVPAYTEEGGLNFGSAGTSDIAVADPLSTVCVACRQDDNGMLYLGFSDSDPTHAPRDAQATQTLDFYRNGVLALSSDTPNVYKEFINPFATDLPMLPDAATYRLDWTARQGMEPGASTETDWTFHSSPGDAAAALSSNNHCAPDASRACSFLPLLFPRYDLAFNEATQAKASGPFDINFTVAYQQNQAAPVGVGATVSVSYDDGKTWTDARAATALGNNRFGVTVTHPDLAATTGFVSLRVTAHDGAGNSVVQTVIHAYALIS